MIKRLYKNDVERAGFDCFGIAVNDIEAELGGVDMIAGLTETGTSNAEETALAGDNEEETEEEETEEP